MGPDPVLTDIAHAQKRFHDLVGDLRPELHRYCARMTGSVVDGEDIVQEALAKALYALGQMNEPPSFRPWLFRIAHNAAMDFLRRYDRKHVDLVAEVPEPAPEEDPGVDPDLVHTAIARFAALPPVQRSAVVLKDVLGHSLEESAATMGTSVQAVKAALVRARANLKAEDRPTTPPRANPQEDLKLQRYVELFNARDWDGLRSLLGDECRLDLVSRAERRGAAVGEYYGRYAVVEDIRCERGTVDGTPAIGVYVPAASERPLYFILLRWDGERICLIRDFRYVPYIAEGAVFIPAPEGGAP